MVASHLHGLSALWACQFIGLGLTNLDINRAQGNWVFRRKLCYLRSGAANMVLKTDSKLDSGLENFDLKLNINLGPSS